MSGTNRLSAIDQSAPAMGRALPGLPVRETIFVQLLRLCLASMGDFFAGEFRKIGINEHCFHVLCLLMASESERASPSDLADLVGTSRANMTRILGMLVDDGFVVREAEALDGRRYMIRITESGRDAARRSVAHLAGPLQAAFAGLSDAELDQFEVLLRKCVASFSEKVSPFRPVEPVK
ncbi:MAG: MarR family winged helix-turn-helix transcriptional regulator [Flavobacteriaceae bacterium]